MQCVSPSFLPFLLYFPFVSPSFFLSLSLSLSKLGFHFQKIEAYEFIHLIFKLFWLPISTKKQQRKVLLKLTTLSNPKDRSRMASSSTTSSHYYSPCAACKFLRRKCLPGCVFAPYFPPEEPQKFANVHKVFGASNVSKLLNEVLPHERQDAVASLAYEADARIRDPVYGCGRTISFLQKQVESLQKELDAAQARLFVYSFTDFSTPPPLIWNHNNHDHHFLSANSSMYFNGGI